jgi:hypothetical protein
MEELVALDLQHVGPERHLVEIVVRPAEVGHELLDRIERRQPGLHADQSDAGG